ncbi:hypothetical protein TSUD_13560 [Trifolium subterraneum]|uniref:Uncharacterized protein n=1 Tax=Trifolium subterraneum TaxID=3900 RepID=A0A2Z6NDI1_TRISU|nr:hypothetical protein TSUD_13560 [Trifolium subterraneum]
MTQNEAYVLSKHHVIEEDNISETDKKNLLEDTSEHANEKSQEENQNLPTKDVVENGSNIYSDTTIEHGKDGHDADDNVEEKIQTISIPEANDADENASMIGSDYSLEDTHAIEISMENQMHPKSDEEGFKEKGIGLASEHATMELGNISMQEESCGDDVKDEIQMIPIAEAKDVEEKEATRLVSHNIGSKNENDSLEGGDAHESDINMENQMHPIDEAEDVEEKVSMQEECCGDDVNEKTRMILTDEVKDVEVKGVGLVSQNVERKLENDSLEGDANESDINMENQMHPKPEEEDVEAKATTEVGKVSMEEECCGDDVKEKIPVIPKGEVKDVEEKATEVTSHNIESKLENDSLEGDANESDISMENQMHQKSEDVMEKATTEPGKVSMQEECRGDDVKEKFPMIPRAEVKDVQEKATKLLNSHNIESKLENDTLEGDANGSDINIENQMYPKPEEDVKEKATTEIGKVLMQEERCSDDVKQKIPMIPTDEVKDVEEKAIGMASDHTNSLENDLLKDKDDLEIAAGMSYDGETSELEDEDKKDGNMIIPFMNGIENFQGKTTILASNDPLILRNSFGGEGL